MSEESIMANCPRCGAQMDNGARFCGACGFDASQASNQSNNSYTSYQQPQQNNSYTAYQQPQQNNSYADYQQNNQYGYQQNYQPTPKATLPTDRNLVKLILLSLVTFGIYPLVWWTVLTDHVNLLCDRRDGKHSTHYLLMTFLITGLTCGIGYIVWIHNMSNRIGNELRARGINYEFNAGTYWLWNVLGSFIFVGPFVYMHKLCTAMNLISENYNYYG